MSDSKKSFTCFTNSLFNLPLDPTTFKLLLFFISLKNLDSIFPSVSYLTKKIGVKSSNSIRKSLKTLVKMRFIEIKTTVYSTNQYILMDKIHEFVPPSKNEVPPSKNEVPPLQNLNHINKSIKNTNLEKDMCVTDRTDNARDNTHTEQEQKDIVDLLRPFTYENGIKSNFIPFGSVKDLKMSLKEVRAVSLYMHKKHITLEKHLFSFPDKLTQVLSKHLNESVKFKHRAIYEDYDPRKDESNKKAGDDFFSRLKKQIPSISDEKKEYNSYENNEKYVLKRVKSLLVESKCNDERNVLGINKIFNIGLPIDKFIALTDSMIESDMKFSNFSDLEESLKRNIDNTIF